MQADDIRGKDKERARAEYFARFRREVIENAHQDGHTILYAGPIDDCPEEIWAQWEQQAQARAAQDYGPVDPALAARIYVD